MYKININFMELFYRTISQNWLKCSFFFFFVVLDSTFHFKKLFLLLFLKQNWSVLLFSGDCIRMLMVRKPGLIPKFITYKHNALFEWEFVFSL